MYRQPPDSDVHDQGTKNDEGDLGFLDGVRDGPAIGMYVGSFLREAGKVLRGRGDA